MVMKIISVIGNRPQFIKAAIVQRALKQCEQKPFEMVVVHTGQHYDVNLNDVFFDELDIDEPQYNLGVGSADITDQIAHMLLKLNPILNKERPDALMVYGDTNSTIAGSLAAAHKNIPVIHIEAGERLYIRDKQPEEINRIVTDSLSSLCLTSSKKAMNQLELEGINSDRINFVGDTMYDLFIWAQERIQQNSSNAVTKYNLTPGTYILSTIHRAENTDNTERLLNLFSSLDDMDSPVIMPVHPRTEKALKKAGWKPSDNGSLRLVDPCGYLDLITLLNSAKYVITDSGGLSRESFFAKKLSIVPMSAPPWPEIKDAGWMYMANVGKEDIKNIISRLKIPNEHPIDHFGSGHAGKNIVNALKEFLNSDETIYWRPRIK